MAVQPCYFSQKANTANAFSLPELALSTVNLFSAVHPESYHIVDTIVAHLHEKTEDIIGYEKLIEKLDPHSFVSEETGLPTVTDILEEHISPTNN